jgi:hypothetical protein
MILKFIASNLKEFCMLMLSLLGAFLFMALSFGIVIVFGLVLGFAFVDAIEYVYCPEQPSSLRNETLRVANLFCWLSLTVLSTYMVIRSIVLGTRKSYREFKLNEQELN